ncbi:MAG: hypothetical protein H7X97_10180 [Opitutaceae bacterium]|nr:hypothetical protein [Verrucomicrobiales bacterium]
MKDDPMDAQSGGTKAGETRQQLLDLRQRLLALHKALIDSERKAYEETFGIIESQNRFLQLLISDPWFAWLHPVSELVVLIDETLEADEPPTVECVVTLRTRTRALLVASEEGDGFPRSYFEALQREAEVVLAHADVARCLKAR